MYLRIGPAEGYEWTFPDNDADYDVFARLDGTPQAHSWIPVPVHRDKTDRRSPGWTADFPWLPGSLILSERAMDVVGDVLKDPGELLPLRTADATKLWVFNAPSVQALDEEASELWKFSDGRIMHIKVPVLVHGPIGTHDVFRVHPARGLFASERFATRVRQAGLSGLAFEVVASHE